ncbi:hypothetical protein N7481_003422 [Penicillium waksmanii]|uniref:uncharacterized protein n=1 Tax=Penicillium waksmanii TaxID=69791 RepID=UPI002547D20A|nr:uncharacterized protein N7481_003422 [Penicillium waksmanii]KAJ5988212.1 hypothetical protein N7481_003422 [Penicillium waksmanii]
MSEGKCTGFMQVTAGMFAIATWLCYLFNHQESLNDSHVQDIQCGYVDSDIIGDGVRRGILIQEIVLTVIALVGLTHPSPTAAKEVGGGLLITHVSLAIALHVALGRGQLSMTDAIFGSMVLGSQNIALSVALVMKETLASRWEVCLVLLGQFKGLISLAVLMVNFLNNKLSTEKCKCFSVIWWTWFSNCPTSSPNDRLTFWIYFSLRFLIYGQSAYIALKKFQNFDSAEKAEKREKERVCGSHELCRFCSSCSKCCHKDHAPDACNFCEMCSKCKTCGIHLYMLEPRFSLRPATSSLLFAEYAIFSFVTLKSADHLRDFYNIQESSQIYSIGQVTALVIAGLTALRASWVFLYMFQGDLSPIQE